MCWTCELLIGHFSLKAYIKFKNVILLQSFQALPFANPVPHFYYFWIVEF